MARLVELVSGERLVTLTGPPGVGKSHLARGVVDRLEDDGIRPVWCDLAEVGQTDDVAAALATAAGFANLDALLTSLTDAPSVVVLEACDQLVDGVSAAVEHLLEGDGDLRVLATSQRPLGVDGERLWVVAPLPVPAGGSGDELRANPAVALYLERCASAGPEPPPRPFRAPAPSAWSPRTSRSRPAPARPCSTGRPSPSAPGSCWRWPGRAAPGSRP